MSSLGRLLHIGCGGEALPSWIPEYEEVRLDINAECKPHIVADMRDLGEIGLFDVVFCSHALEHVYPHEVAVVLSGFHRVLKRGGKLMLIVPDLQGVEPTHKAVFYSPAGPITGMDLLYGYGAALPFEPHMAHHCGFVQETLKEAMEQAGFTDVLVQRVPDYNLIGTGAKA